MRGGRNDCVRSRVQSPPVGPLALPPPVFGVRFWFVNAVREHVRVRSVRVRSVLRRPMGPLFANTAVREQFVRVRSDSGPRKRLPRSPDYTSEMADPVREKTQNDPCRAPQVP